MTVAPVKRPTPTFRYGAAFFDDRTGIRFEAHHPQERPDLWIRYLDGLHKRFAKHGFGEIVDRDQLLDGSGVSMFFVGLDQNDDVVAGIRIHGPLDSVDQASTLQEMSRSPEIDRLRRIVARYIPYGVIEGKGAWGRKKGAGLHSVMQTLMRCWHQALAWTESEVLLGVVNERNRAIIAATGARELSTQSVPFPTDELRAILMWGRRPRTAKLCDPDQARRSRIEADQLRSQLDSSTSGWSSPAAPASNSWRCIVLDERTRAQRQIIRTLSSDPQTVVIDRLADQRAELERLVPRIGHEIQGETPRYVYFPWRSTLVKMLGPTGFERLRLDRNRNKVTLEEQARFRSLRIGIVGLSVGHVIAHTLALEGLCGELRLADMDRIELSNLNRIPDGVFDLGVNKAVAAARRIAEIDPYLPVRLYPAGVDRSNVEDFLDGLDLVVEECDSFDVKLLVREAAKKRRIPVIMETSDRGLFDVERYDVEPEHQPFHGLLGALTSSELAKLTIEETIPYLLRVVGAEKATARGAASLLEIGATLSTWPQLGGDVTLGAATVAAAVRRFGLGQPLPSGQIRIDLDELLGSGMAPPPQSDDPAPAALAHRTLAGPSEQRAQQVLTEEGEPPVPEHPDLAVAYAANRAPSGGNAQPWRFELRPGALYVYLDIEETNAMDVHYRASHVAIGAALFNARVAAAAQGRPGVVELFPEGPDGPVGVLRYSAGGADERQLASLYRAMLERGANRKNGDGSPLHPDLVRRLVHAVSAEGAQLQLITDREQLDRCANVLAESDRLRFLSPVLHRSMMRELRWPGRDPLEDGIDVRSLELPPHELASLSIIARPEVMKLLAEWDGGGLLTNRAKAAIRTCSALAVVTIRDSRLASYVSGGMAVERLWIEAQRADLSVQPYSPASAWALDDEDFVVLGGEGFARPLREMDRQFRSAAGLGPDAVLAIVLRLSTHTPPPSVRSFRRRVEQRTTTLCDR